MRRATINRTSKETEIDLVLTLDGTATASVDTGLPFLDHMLEAWACHGRFDLEVKARGDLEVDPHHLVEDLGIVLGRALLEALNLGGSVQRAGFFLFPMDGSLARVAIDLCGRPNLVWNVEVGSDPLGSLPPPLLRDFFKGFVDGGRATLHADLIRSDGDHHALEALFKAFGRALCGAVNEVGGTGPLSTKGVIDA